MGEPVNVDGEVWSRIVRYSDFWVSNLGRVFCSDLRLVKLYKLDADSDGYLDLELDNNGYLIVFLGDGYKKVHRLVAEAFIEDYTPGCFIEFCDENKQNVRLDNLKAGLSSVRRIFVPENGRYYDSIYDAARKLKLNRGHINECCLGKRKSCGGYSFQYADFDSKPRRKRRILAYKRYKKQETERIFNSQNEAAKVLGLCQSNISRALKYDNYDCDGWHFEWVDE